MAGFVTLVIVFAALLLGWWIGDQLGQRGLCITGALLASVPVSLYTMLRITLGALKRVQPQINKDLSDTVEEG